MSRGNTIRNIIPSYLHIPKYLSTDTLVLYTLVMSGGNTIRNIIPSYLHTHLSIDTLVLYTELINECDNTSGATHRPRCACFFKGAVGGIGKNHT